MMRKTILFLLSLLLTLPMAAQELQVKSMVTAIDDMTANMPENQVKDPNGEYGGLVKVRIASPDAEFEGLILKEVKHNASEYWIFMPKNSRKLTVVIPGYLPLDVYFRNYGINGIEPLKTYLLTIVQPPKSAPVIQDDGMSYFIMQVEPKNANVFIDGMLQYVELGNVVVCLPKGTHSYQVSAPGYKSEEGTVEVGDEKSLLNIRLTSTMATVSVECPTKGAQVYVNGKLKGTAPWKGSINPGKHLIEARLDSYSPQQQDVTVTENGNQTVKLPALKKK